jgi:hypothetical protein
MKLITINLNKIENLLQSRSLDELAAIDVEIKKQISYGNAIYFEKDGESCNATSIYHDVKDLYSFYYKFLESKCHLLFKTV